MISFDLVKMETLVDAVTFEPRIFVTVSTPLVQIHDAKLTLGRDELEAMVGHALLKAMGR